MKSRSTRIVVLGGGYDGVIAALHIAGKTGHHDSCVMLIIDLRLRSRRSMADPTMPSSVR